MNYLLVGIGGACGSLTRFGLGKLISSKSKSKFPVGTFFINVSGAFLLGVISNMNLVNNGYLLLGDGFLGAYTTFSTFMYESFQLFSDRKLNAFIYIISSIVLGLAGFTAGAWITRLILN